MNVIDRIQINENHRWEIIKDAGIYHVIVFDKDSEEVVTNASDDTLSTALCCVYNRINMSIPIPDNT